MPACLPDTLEWFSDDSSFSPRALTLSTPAVRVLRKEKCVESIILIIQVYVTEQREQ
jgi:hypothetical protein